MAEEAFDPIKSWFIAAEELDEFIGIRFGHMAADAGGPEWMFLRHTDFDGIGGLAELLRQRGAVLSKLPHQKHPRNPSWGPLAKSIPKMMMPRRPLAWSLPSAKSTPTTSTKSPPAVAWHLFGETETTQIRRACRKGTFTVNSFLLKHLSKAIRPSLKDESSVIPWMVPVNLRGKVTRERDTANYSSYVGVRVCSYETVRDIHRNIYAALGQGEHWANWYAYGSGRLIGKGMKKFLISSGRAMAESYLGGFSNLGDWDPDKKITSPDCEGAWFFAPPVLRCQMVGAGCVTYQNQLALTVHAHPELTTDITIPQGWMANWVKEIELDLSSMLSDSVPPAPSFL